MRFSRSNRVTTAQTYLANDVAVGSHVTHSDQSRIEGPKAALVLLYERAQKFTGAPGCRPVSVRWRTNAFLPAAHASRAGGGIRTSCSIHYSPPRRSRLVQADTIAPHGYSDFSILHNCLWICIMPQLPAERDNFFVWTEHVSSKELKEQKQPLSHNYRAQPPPPSCC